jgi:hypothetical protein
LNVESRIPKMRARRRDPTEEDSTPGPDVPFRGERPSECPFTFIAKRDIVQGG